jgi:GntR family transcriptional regulator/MocR family aminotransferase
VDLFPYQIWNRLQSRRWKHVAEFDIARSQQLGTSALREAIAAHCALMRGFDYQPDQVVITTSVPAALELIMRALGLSGCSAWVEDPGNPAAASVFNRRNIEIVPVPVDESGLKIADGIRKAPDAKIAYVTPACQFPTCAVLSAARRRTLIDWAQASGSWILEDDYDWQSCPQPKRQAPLALDDRTNTIYINSLNPLLFPALQIAYVICPPSLVDRFTEARSALHEPSNVLHQMMLADFIEAGYLGDHIARLSAACDERREALHTALARELDTIVEPNIFDRGTHVPATLLGHNEHDFADRCASESIIAKGAAEYHFAPPATNEVLFGFSAFHPPIIDKGVRAIARAIRAN